MALKKQGTNKNLLILGAIILVVLAAIIAYGYSASQKNKEMAEKAAAYNAQKEAKAKAEERRKADLARRLESQRKAWGERTPEEKDKAELEQKIARTANHAATTTPKLGTAEYFDKCERLVRLKIAHPSTASFSIFSANIYHAPNGNVVATMPFTAKNSYDTKLQFSARCLFTTEGDIEVNVVNR